MNILIVGNVLKDIYLNLDSRTESFETDQYGTKWLDFAFNATEHHFFSREASLGGAAVTLEILQKMGLESSISNSSLNFNTEEIPYQTAEAYRYIMITDSKPSYLVPNKYQSTTFETPSSPYDYLYIDRSATIDQKTAKTIEAYLDVSPNTKLILYAHDFSDPNLNQFIHRASVVFYEDRGELNNPSVISVDNIDPNKLIRLSDTEVNYLNITEHISVHRIDVMTHLSAYSIIAATILGAFILGYSVEDSLKMAQVNVENSKLNATLPLEKLKQALEDYEDRSTPDSNEELELIAKNLVLHPKGILAADESGGSIHKKFEQLQIEDTYDNRRDYRNIFFTTPDIEKYINGVILFDETARQLADNGQNFVEYLTGKRIVPGIKVDQGLEPLEEGSQETYTKGLDGLSERLKEYYQMGLRFAKWRAAFEIRLDNQGNQLTPSEQAITKNCQILAQYALECQKAGIVPIVEPEVVYDGYYDIDKSAEVTSNILDQLFKELDNSKVNLKGCLLKTSMVIAGKQLEKQSTPEEVGARTAEVLKNHVPENLAGIVFLSGGQTPEQATENLAEIIKHGPFPWPVTFSYARALQDPALLAWGGDNANVEKARQAFADRLIANTKVL